jgi:hypothetical protein
LFNPNFKEDDGGKNYTFDPTVIHPQASYLMERFNGNPNIAISEAINRKNKKYLEAATAKGIIFKALAITTYGNICKNTADLIIHLSKKQADVLDMPPSSLVSHLSIGFSIILQRFNALLIYERYLTILTNNNINNINNNKSYNNESLYNNNNIPNTYHQNNNNNNIDADDDLISLISESSLPYFENLDSFQNMDLNLGSDYNLFLYNHFNKQDIINNKTIYSKNLPQNQLLGDPKITHKGFSPFENCSNTHS